MPHQHFAPVAANVLGQIIDGRVVEPFEEEAVIDLIGRLRALEVEAVEVEEAMVEEDI